MTPGSVAPRTVHSVRPGFFLIFLLWTYAAPCRPAHFLWLLFQMLSSDSPGSLSLSAKITKLPSDSPGSLSLFFAKVTTTLTQQNCKAHTQRNSIVSTYFSHAYRYCQEPYLYRLHLANLSHSNGSQVFQPCNDLWYLPKICSRISQICLCISVSNSLRWSRNIAMMSRWFAFIRTSSSNGKSHSMRTIRVCTSLKTLVTLSKPIIHSM